MTLELISHKLCPYVHRAAILLHEKGVPFTRREIDLKNKPDWFVKLSPHGKVPVLLADGVALFESSAICEFLDETHPPSSLPDDPFARAHQRAWAEGATELSQALWNLLIAPSAPELDRTAVGFAAIADRVEQAIAAGVVAPERFERVHVYLAPSLLRFSIVEQGLRLQVLDARRWPRMDALARAIAARPSVTQTVPEDYAAALCRRIVDRGSFLAAKAARQA
ncbi:MAG TPA: glutathione S-transferase family protein [Polyangia bacterium]|nr:glutathione S-transferase family protein [Polyangia bacterium]